MSAYDTSNTYADLTVNQTLIHGDVTLGHHAATKWYVDAQLDAIVSAAPSALDTLKEIADFIGTEDTATTMLSRFTAAETARASLSSALHTEIDAVEGRVDSVSAKLTSEISRVESNMDDLSAALHTEIDSVEALALDVSADLVSEIVRVESNIATLSNNVTTQIAGEIKELSDQVSNDLSGKLDTSDEYQKRGDGHFQVNELSERDTVNETTTAYLYIGDFWRIAADNNGKKQLNFEYNDGNGFKVGIPFCKE